MFCMATVAMCHIAVLKCTRSCTYLVSMAWGKHLESGFLPEYVTSIHVADAESKQCYVDTIQVVGCDPYELPGREWKDNVDLWPAITYVHVCMHLILNSSPYTKDDMLNYESFSALGNLLQ